MSKEKSNIVHTEVMELEASVEQVRSFIMTPERILDYYPGGVGAGELEPGHALYCHGAAGVSILERIEDECTESCVVVNVITAFGLEPPYTRERIEQNVGFTMIEDWELTPNGAGTTLTKTWRDVTSMGPDPFPTDAIREGAIHESPLLVQRWNAAAKAS
ncbi:SRPBCC family protein [Myxococcota bacterium]|nr:SRPBCC family protein [Myxococcota bacterium]